MTRLSHGELCEYWPLTRAMLIIEAETATVAKACYDFHRTRYIHPDDKLTTYVLSKFICADLSKALARLLPAEASAYPTKVLILPARNATVVIQNNAEAMDHQVIQRLKVKSYMVRCDGALSDSLPEKRDWALYLYRKSSPRCAAFLAGQNPPDRRALFPHEMKMKKRGARTFGFASPPEPFTDAHVLEALYRLGFPVHDPAFFLTSPSAVGFELSRIRNPKHPGNPVSLVVAKQRWLAKGTLHVAVTPRWRVSCYKRAWNQMDDSQRATVEWSRGMKSLPDEVTCHLDRTTKTNIPAWSACRVGRSFVHTARNRAGSHRRKHKLMRFKSSEARDAWFAKEWAKIISAGAHTVKRSTPAEGARWWVHPDGRFVYLLAVWMADVEMRGRAGGLADETLIPHNDIDKYYGYYSVRARELQSKGFTRRRPPALAKILSTVDTTDKQPSGKPTVFSSKKRITRNRSFDGPVTVHGDLVIRHAVVVVPGTLRVQGSLSFCDASLHVQGDLIVDGIVRCLQENSGDDGGLGRDNIRIDKDLSCRGLYTECFMTVRGNIQTTLVHAPGNDHLLTCKRLSAKLVVADRRERIECGKLDASHIYFETEGFQSRIAGLFAPEYVKSVKREASWPQDHFKDVFAALARKKEVLRKMR